MYYFNQIVKKIKNWHKHIRTFLQKKKHTRLYNLVAITCGDGRVMWHIKYLDDVNITNYTW